MICFPNAKINLGLNVISWREDGFHNIETVFYPLKLSDILEIIVVEGNAGVAGFQSSGTLIPGNPDTNLCLKGYRLLEEDHSLPAVSLHLHKIIPVGAGLGGGSSD